MNAAPQSPLVRRVAVAICPWVDRRKQAHPPEVVWENLTPESQTAYLEQAQAALDACHAEEMIEALKASHAHVQELRGAWQRGAISEHDGQGGTRSNRNVDVEVQLRGLLAKLGEAGHAL